MAISSEIEKLEKRWQATSGLVFAPLAEAYRKAGLKLALWRSSSRGSPSTPTTALR